MHTESDNYLLDNREGFQLKGKSASLSLNLDVMLPSSIDAESRRWL